MSDILNFITKDSSISMTFEIYETMLYMAKAAERERIIKLLEQTDQLVFMNDGYADNMADTVIALIKGENK